MRLAAVQQVGRLVSGRTGEGHGDAWGEVGLTDGLGGERFGESVGDPASQVFTDAWIVHALHDEDELVPGKATQHVRRTQDPPQPLGDVLDELCRRSEDCGRRWSTERPTLRTCR